MGTVAWDPSIHDQLEWALADIMERIEERESDALARLDLMVEAGDRRQALRMFSWQLQQRAEFRTLFGSVYRTPDDQARLYAEWKLRGGVGAVAGSSLHERHLALDFYVPYMIQDNKIVVVTNS